MLTISAALFLAGLARALMLLNSSNSWAKEPLLMVLPTLAAVRQTVGMVLVARAVGTAVVCDRQRVVCGCCRCCRCRICCSSASGAAASAASGSRRYSCLCRRRLRVQLPRCCCCSFSSSVSVSASATAAAYSAAAAAAPNRSGVANSCCSRCFRCSRSVRLVSDYGRQPWSS